MRLKGPFRPLAARALALALAGVWPAAPAAAQSRGVIEGRLINGTDPRIVGADVELDVIQLGGGMSIVKSAVSGPQGRFRIEDLPTEAPLMVRANYKSVNYHGRAAFDAARKANVEIEIFETTSSMSGIRVDDVRMGFQLDGDHVRVLETYTFFNETAPKRSFSSPEGSFRLSKLQGLEAVPQMSVTGPGSSMPLQQSPLESADGSSYYSLYPLRPGKTTFEVQYTLPYHDRTYALRKRIYYDLPSVQVGVSPHDLALAVPGLEQVHIEAARKFAVYRSSPLKAGAELVGTFSGGTAQAASDQASSESKIKPMPNDVGRNTLLIAPLLLMAFVAVLWYAHNTVVFRPGKGPDARTRELRARRDSLLDLIVQLDTRNDEGSLERREYVRRREQAKRQLRRVAMLLGKK